MRLSSWYEASCIQTWPSSIVKTCGPAIMIRPRSVSFAPLETTNRRPALTPSFQLLITDEP